MTGAPRFGLTVTHRRYVSYSHAHYGGNLVDGAYVLGLFGDVGTEACIRSDGDEGLFASYSDVQFLAPVRAGDVIEVTATLTGSGTRSRELAFEARVLCRADPARAVGRPGPGRAHRGGDRGGHRGGAAAWLAVFITGACRATMELLRRWWCACSGSSTRPW